MRFCKADLLVSGSWFVLSADLPVSLWQIVCITAAAQMLAGVIPTPAGLGSLEFVFLIFSTKIVGAAEAGAAMILLRCAVNIIPLVLGALLALTDRRKRKEAGNDRQSKLWSDLARMSVIIKSQHETSVMTGNYEMGYACGLLCKLAGREVPAVGNSG